MFIYSFLWLNILRLFTLTEAFSAKGITVVWGIIWGFLIFSEKISTAKIVAAALIILGITLLGRSNE
jgi:drug/metabolite transporter (DMT)-like permease